MDVRLRNGRIEPSAGIGVFWGDEDRRNIARRYDGRQTSQAAELMATVAALRQARDTGIRELIIKTSSKYLLYSIEEMKTIKTNNWRGRNGWTVPNEEELRQLDDAMNLCYWNIISIGPHDVYHGTKMAFQLAEEGAIKPLQRY